MARSVAETQLQERLVREVAVDKSGRRVRSMFASIAGKYDLLNHLLSLNIDRSWRRFTTQDRPARAGRAGARLLHRHGRPGAWPITGRAAGDRRSSGPTSATRCSGIGNVKVRKARAGGRK